MKHLLLIGAGVLALIVIVLLVSGAFLSETPAKQTPTITTEQVEPVEPAELQSTTTPSGETFIIDRSVPIEDRCTPVTKACLEAQPEWDVTAENDSLKRVDPDTLNMFNEDIELDEFVLGETGDVFTLVVPRGDISQEHCVARGIEIEGALCPPYELPVYTELAIAVTETGEIVHAFQMINNYSWGYMSYCVPGRYQICDGLYGRPINSSKVPKAVSLEVWQWDDIEKKNPSLDADSLERYIVDLYSGNIERFIPVLER